MADKTNIEWCDATWSPWEGCQKVSPACDNCYAANRNQRFHGGVNWGPHGARRRTSKSYWRKPLLWQKQAKAFYLKHGRKRRVFPSLCDPFDNHRSITAGWHGDFWHLIDQTPDLDWLLLTKRPQNFKKMLPESYGMPEWGEGWPNVWIGATCEDQKRADINIPHLLEIECAVRFVSYEPALGPVDLSRWLYQALDVEKAGLSDDPMAAFMLADAIDAGSGSGPMRPKIDWIIAGGESGPNARPTHLDWFRSVRDQCANAGVPFIFKQWGEYRPVRLRWILENDFDISKHFRDEFSGQDYVKVGKKYAGRLLDGRTHDGFPKAVQS